MEGRVMGVRDKELNLLKSYLGYSSMLRELLFAAGIVQAHRAPLNETLLQHYLGCGDRVHK